MILYRPLDTELVMTLVCSSSNITIVLFLHTSNGLNIKDDKPLINDDSVGVKLTSPKADEFPNSTCIDAFPCIGADEQHRFLYKPVLTTGWSGGKTSPRTLSLMEDVFAIWMPYKSNN